MLPLSQITAERIALIKPSAVGDIVHALPVLSALRNRFPNAHITWVVNQSYAALLEGHVDLDDILTFDRGAGKRSWLGGVRSLIQTLSAIRRRRFDLVIDLQGLLRSGLMTWLSGSARRVGLFSAREGSHRAYTDLLPAPAGKTLADLHAVDRYWLVAEALGVGELPKRFAVPIKTVDRDWAVSQLLRWPKPWLMLNLGTRWETKRWPVQHFQELAQLAIQRAGGSVVLVGSGAERGLAAAFQHGFHGGLVDLTGSTTLGQLAAVLKQADVVISNDSGPLHLAAALGRPVVAPFTCTSIVRTGPYNQLQAAVPTRLWCAASYLKTCARMECMTELTPERLWPVLERHLITWQRQSA
jgi:lipopolysaccharide heptosyltransferase I